MKRTAAWLTVVTFGATLAQAPSAHADEIAGTPKAIVGGGLLGAEVVIIPMGIAGVQAGWAYAVFPGLGAVGGVIGGYFIDHAYDTSGSAGNPPQPAYGSAFMLAGGIALIIPAVILMLNATRYRPSVDATEDKAPTNKGPEANPGQAGGTVTGGGGGGNQPPHVPLSLIDVHEGAFRMGIPVPEVRNSYSLHEVKELGVKQATELHVPVMSVAF